MLLAGLCQTVTGRQIALGTLRARRVHFFLRDHALVLLAVCFSAKRKKNALFLFYLLHFVEQYRCTYFWRSKFTIIERIIKITRIMGRYLVLKRAIRFVSVVRLRKQREDETIYRITEHRPGVYPESKRSPSTFPRAPASFKGEIPRHRKVGIAQRALNETATYFIRPRDFPFPLLSRVVRFSFLIRVRRLRSLPSINFYVLSISLTKL